jgi:hypothetical protein
MYPRGRGRKIMREVTVTEVADVLDEAVRLYESGTYGWVQGEYSYDVPGETPRRCMQGILDMANASINFHNDHVLQVQMTARAAVGDKIGHIPTWNDTPGRTLDEVIEMLKSVSKDLRNSQ